MILSRQEQGALVAFAINHLPHRDDLLAEDNDIDWGCCPRCCAGCEVLRSLVDQNYIDLVLRGANVDLGVTRYDWWDKEKDCFDRGWLDVAWNHYPCPNHVVAE